MTPDKSPQHNELPGVEIDIRHFPFELRMLSSLIHSVPLNIYAKDVEGRFIFANVHYCQNVGRDLREIIGKTDIDIHPRELAEKYRSDDRAIMKSQETRKIEESWSSIGGKTNYVQVIKAPLRDNISPDKVIGTVGIFWDITKNKTAEKQVQEERNFLRTIIDSIPSFVYAKDVNGCFITANKAAAEFMGGNSPDELIGKSDFDVFPRDVAEGFAEKEQLLLQSGTRLDDLVETYTYKGREYTINTAKKTLRNLDGDLIGLVGVGHDITEMKHIENQLRESEERYAAVINQAIEGIYLIDPTTKTILESNESFQDMIGYTQEELKNISVYDFVLDSYGEIDANIKSVMDQEERIVGDRNYLTKNGEILDVEVSAKLIQYSGRKAVLVIIRDTSERKQAEKEKEFLREQLRQAQKLEAIGTLAGGVAHDLNNILAGIVSYPELMLLSLPEDSPHHKHLKTIQQAGERAAAIVADLLTVARGVACTKETHSLNSLLQDQLESPENEKIVNRNRLIELEINLSNRAGNIACSPVHVKKCVMNLIINAVEAVDGSGNLYVGTDSIQVKKKDITQLGIPQGTYNIVTVKDDGSGIPEDDLPHIFEPFYTKKKMGTSGSGLGLSIVWNTMLDHDGTVTVESGENGTAFTLYFPATEQTSTKEKFKTSPFKIQGNGEHILVIDDDPTLLELAEQILENLGYQVTLAGSGEEALEFLNDHQVDLILIDMLMEPGMNGYETYSNLLKIHPKQKAIIVSGYSENKDVHRAQQLGAGKFISKPYTIQSLGTAIKHELATDL